MEYLPSKDTLMSFVFLTPKLAPWAYSDFQPECQIEDLLLLVIYRNRYDSADFSPSPYQLLWYIH